MSVQTTYDAAPNAGIAGQIADDGPHDIGSYSVDTDAITAGLIVLKGASDGQARPILVTDEITADTDAIMTAQATSTSAQSCTGATLDGVVGAGVFWPPRNVTLTANNHANWDLSTITVEGLGPDGEPVSESFAMPDGGNVTLTGVVAFTQITTVKIPIQAGTSGTLDVGLGVAMGQYDRYVVGLALYNAAREPGTYAANKMVPVLKKGRAWVSTEGSVNNGDPVYVRIVATGNEVRGSVRATPDSTDCALLRRAKFVSTRSGAGLAMIELGGPV